MRIVMGHHTQWERLLMQRFEATLIATRASRAPRGYRTPIYCTTGSDMTALFPERHSILAWPGAFGSDALARYCISHAKGSGERPKLRGESVSVSAPFRIHGQSITGP